MKLNLRSGWESTFWTFKWNPLISVTAALFRFQDRPFLVRFHDGMEPELLGVDFDAG